MKGRSLRSLLFASFAALAVVLPATAAAATSQLRVGPRAGPYAANLAVTFEDAGISTLIPAVVTPDMRRAVQQRQRSNMLRFGTPRVLPFLSGTSRAVYLARKAAALHNPYAPRSFFGTTVLGQDAFIPFTTPAATNKIDGLEDSFFICPPGGCQPPDMGLASSGKFTVQAVNAAVGVFKNGPPATQALGFPLDYNAFLGGMPAAITAACTASPTGAFFSDPRAFFDPNGLRFFVSILQLDGSVLEGDACPNTSIEWIAVSKTSDPTGGWNVYHFDSSRSGVDLGDFPTLGFNKSVVTVGVNDFNFTTLLFAGNALYYLHKPAMEAGLATAVKKFTDMTEGGILIDTMQPVLTEAATTADPGADIIVATKNINFGGGNCASGCSTLFIFGFTSPFTASGFFNTSITTPTYTNAPMADTPPCSGSIAFVCPPSIGGIDTSDTRISAQPVWIPLSGGTLSAAVETGVTNLSGVVPAVLWLEANASLSGSVITASLLEGNYINSASGDEAFSFGTTMLQSTGNLFVLTDFMSATVYNSTGYQFRSVSDPLGTLQAAVTLHAGIGPTFDFRWGDYEAASPGAAGSVWFSSQYAGGGADWATRIANIP